MPADMNEIAHDLSRVKDWAARHDATCTERHEHRRTWEKETDGEIASIKADLVSLKIKLALIAGTGATLGGGVGAAIANLFM